MAIGFRHTSHTTKLIIIGEFLLVSYLLYTLTASVYKSYLIDQHIMSFEVENKRIEEENRIKSEEFDYYSSDSYKEKIAKQNLGLVIPGEEVIIIPSESFDDYVTGSGSALDDMNATEYSALSNPERWWKFFFDIKR